MDSDLDPFGDILPEPSLANARAAGRFKPKGKPLPATSALPKILDKAKSAQPIGSTLASAGTNESSKDENVKFEVATSSTQIEDGLASSEVVTSDGKDEKRSSSLLVSGAGCSLGYGLDSSGDVVRDTDSGNDRVGFEFQCQAGKQTSSLIISSVPDDANEKSVDVVVAGCSTPPIQPVDEVDAGSVDPVISQVLGNDLSCQNVKVSCTYDKKSLEEEEDLSSARIQSVDSTQVPHLEVTASDGNDDHNHNLQKSMGQVESLEGDFSLLDDVLPELYMARSVGKLQPKVKSRAWKEHSAPVSSSLAVCTNKEHVTEGDSMEFDLDPFCDIASDLSTTNARAGGKFQPRGKAQPGKGISTTVEKSTVLDPKVSADTPPVKSIDVGDGKLVTKDPSQTNDKLCPGLLLDEPAKLVLIGAPQLSVSVEEPNSRLGKSVGEHADIFSGLECIHEFVTQSTSGTDIPASASNDEDALVVEQSKLAAQSAFQKSMAFANLQSPDIFSDTTVASDSRTRKFLPQPKLQNINEKSSAPTVAHSMDTQFVPSETICFDEGSIPDFQSDDAVDYSSLHFGDLTTSEFPMNQEQTNIAQSSANDANAMHSEDVSGKPDKEKSKSRERKFSLASNLSQKSSRSPLAVEINEGGRSSRQQRKRKVAPELVDEPEDEAGGFPAQPSSSTIADEQDKDYEYREDEIEDDDHGASSSQKRRVSKRKKPVAEKEKPQQKHEKVSDASDKSTQKPTKKFSHSTHRKKRLQELLAIPEDEIDFRSLPCRDIILLAGYKEKLANKERTSNASLNNQGEQDTFGSEQNIDDQSNRTQSDPPLFNSHSFMDRTPRVRWTKQDTELFYEGVRQFGTDLSMIQQLFPGRTRHQIKLKLKKEERQEPLKLYEALSNRSKDHSYFEKVIEQLRQAAAKEEEEFVGDDSIDATGNEESEFYSETNEGVGRSEINDDNVEEYDNIAAVDQETNAADVQSPVKSDENDDDDLDIWSSYRSEF